MAAPGQGTQASQQFAEIEWLGDVIVSTAVQTLDARFDLVARREHQDRNRGARRAQLLTDAEPVAARQHDVEDHRVVVGNRRVVERLVAVARNIDGVSLFAKTSRQHLRRTRLVFHKEDAHESEWLPGARIHPRSRSTVTRGHGVRTSATIIPPGTGTGCRAYSDRP